MLVTGAGPIGLLIIAVLRAQGISNSDVECPLAPRVGCYDPCRSTALAYPEHSKITAKGSATGVPMGGSTSTGEGSLAVMRQPSASSTMPSHW